MKDLRKWSDIKQALLDYHNSLTMSRYITEEDCRNARFAVEGALYALEDVPAVDAVEVVRCKDCKYEDDNTSCPMLNAVAYTKDDGFCYVGRRGRKIKDISCGGCGKEEKTQEEARKENQNIFLEVRFPKDGE